MKRKSLLIAAIVCICPFAFLSQQAQAQNPDIKRTWHWYFGNGCGLDFSSGTPVVDTNGALHSFESCAVMSDTAGNLLFYTDGDTVWNKLHQSMPNGTGLLGCGNWGSSTSAGLIVPWPTQEDSIFYIFTTDCAENSFASGFRYSLVNLNLDNGKGDVYLKNQLLLQNGTEAIAVTKHANGIDYWLVTHEFNTNNYIVYQISSSGISAPLVQPFGSVAIDYVGYIKFSADGSKMVGGINYPANIFHFDITTGLLFDKINIIAMGESPEFSPDGSKIYSNGGGNQLIMYCLNIWDSVSINSSGYQFTYNFGNDVFGVLKPAPDGKIYIASLFESYDSISVINNPNGYGPQADVVPFALTTQPAGRSTGGLPYFISNYLNFKQTPSACDSTVGIEENHSDTLILFPNPASDILNLKNFTDRGEKQIFLYDYSGKLILKKTTSDSQIRVNVSTYDDSIYILKIQVNNKIFSKKFIIQH